MTTIWIKKDTVPSSIGEYDKDTYTLTINAHVHMFPEFSFTEKVVNIIPKTSGLNFVIQRPNTVPQNIGSASKPWNKINIM
jgi:hypothetical protein